MCMVWGVQSFLSLFSCAPYSLLREYHALLLTLSDLDTQVVATFPDARHDEAAFPDAPPAAERSAADRLAHAVSSLALSPDGGWAALLSPQRAHVFDMAALKYHGPLPALEVRAGAATASCEQGLFSCSHANFSSAQSAARPESLRPQFALVFPEPVAG